MGSVLVLALVSAAIYAVAASGLVLTYTTSGIFNFAHGAIAMFSAFVYWQLSSPAAWDLPIPVALGLTLGVFAPALGWFLDWAIMRRLSDAGPMVRIVVPIGLLVSLISAASMIWPPDTVNARLDDFMLGESVTIAGIAVSHHQIIVLLTAIGVAVGLRYLLYSTRVGIAMRAVVESRNLAALNGVDPRHVSGLSWAIGCVLAATAGILIGPLLSLDQVNLTLLVINAFAAALVGRLRSLPLTFLGAFILGLAMEVVRRWSGDLPDWMWWLTVDTVPVLMLFLVLIVVPQDRAAVFGVEHDRSRVPRVGPGAAVAAGAVLVIATAVIPSLMTGNILNAVGTGLALGLIAISLVPLTGYAGQLSLAPMAFAGIGAIVMYDLGGDGSPLAVLAAMAVCAAVGAVIALPAIRLKGLYLALATMSFAFFCEKSLFARVARRTDHSDYAPLQIGGWAADSRRAQLIVMGVAIALVGVGITLLRRSRFGRGLQAMKDSPAAASTLGINLVLLKVSVFALSAAIAGLGGVLLATWRGQYNAEQFSLLQGGLPGLPLVLMAAVGGIAAVAGAVLGGLLLAIMPMVGTYPKLRDLVDLLPGPKLEDLINLLPGLAGIGLAINPNGAIAQTAEQLSKRFGDRRDAGRAAIRRRAMRSALQSDPPTIAPETIPVGASADPGVRAAIDLEVGLDGGRCRGAAGDI